MSCAGTPSVMQITVAMPGVDRLVDASAANGAGTKIIAVFAPCSATASRPCRRPARPRRPGRPCPGVTPGDEVRPVGAVAEAVEAALGAGQALDDEPRVVVDDDRHQAHGTDPQQRDPVEDDVVAVGRGRRGARRRAAASSPSQPQRSSHGCSSIGFSKKRTSSTAQPRRLDERRATPPRCSCARARGRGASRPPRRPRP